MPRLPSSWCRRDSSCKHFSMNDIFGDLNGWVEVRAGGVLGE